MRIKINILHSRIDYFSENLGAVIEEQGEGFRQNLEDVEERYQIKWYINMVADYCWLLR